MVAPPPRNNPKFTPKAGQFLIATASIPNGRRSISIGDVGKIAAINNAKQTATVSVAARGSVLTQSFTQLQSNWKLK